MNYCASTDGASSASVARMASLSVDATEDRIHQIAATIQVIPNFPKPGILFQDITTLLLICFLRSTKTKISISLQDVYLHTNCLATLENMAPHVHRLSAYASQRLVSLFYMLSWKYIKLGEIKNDKMNESDDDLRGDTLPEDPSAELHIYTDFLRLVLEILNAILTYALPRNPEVIYAIMHRQEVFLPFKNHPRFNELLENIYNISSTAELMHSKWMVNGRLIKCFKSQ